jgi:hypothetical protein
VAAQVSGRLYRDALGFGARGATHLVGFGVGAISQLGGCYAQNPLDQAGWEARIDYGHRAADRGVELGDDDQLRAALLQDILCHGRIDIAQLERHHRIDFRDYFADALGRLRPLFEDGSLTWGPQEIHFDRPARLASQAIASQFDPLLACRCSKHGVDLTAPQPPIARQCSGRCPGDLHAAHISSHRRPQPHARRVLSSAPTARTTACWKDWSPSSCATTCTGDATSIPKTRRPSLPTPPSIPAIARSRRACAANCMRCPPR